MLPLGASYSGFVNGDTAASLTTQPTLTTTATASSHVSGSPYPITASGAADADYSINYGAGTLSVTPVALTISANNLSKVYGAVLPTLTVSYTGLVNGDTAASLTIDPAITTTATNASRVSGSPYSITASGAVDSDYIISYVGGTLTVTPAPLTITANNQNMVVNTTLPTLTASYTGLVNGDTSASLTTQPTLSTNATSNSQISGNPYSITVSGAVDSDYSITYVNGTLNVINQPATTVTLTVGPGSTSIYGQDVTYTATVTSSGNPTPTGTVQFLVDGISFGSPVTLSNGSATIDLLTGLQVGNHTITGIYSGDGNYASNSQSSTQTVTPAALTITTLNNAKVYGAALPTLTASYTGFVNSDTSASLTSPPVLNTTATAHSPVSAGPYTIIASGASDIDYTISYVFGAVTVTPAALTITANNQTKVYGAAMPTLTVSYAGLVNGDTAGTLGQAPNTAPTIVSTATASSHVAGSPYTITASAAVDSNYSISYVSGTFTVTPAALTITANNQTKVYGAALPTLTVSYSGFVNGDTSASLTTQPTVTTTATASSHVSGNPYSITVIGASDGPSGGAFLGTAANYNVYVSGSMAENGGSAASSLAVGGNAAITQFSLAGGSGSGLVVGGNLSATSTQILSGNAQVGGSVTMGTNDNAALVSGATLYYGSTTGNTFPSFPIFNITHAANGGISTSFFSGANATLTSDSSLLESQPQNGTVTFAYGTLTLSGTNTGINYFNVSGESGFHQFDANHGPLGRDGAHQRKRRHGSVRGCEHLAFRDNRGQGSV